MQFVKQENPGIVTRKNEKWWKMLAAIIVFVLLVKTFGVTSCFIPSSGMENSLYKGEGVLINKWAYGLRIPFPSLFGYHRIGKGVIERGDIVLFLWIALFTCRCFRLPPVRRGADSTAPYNLSRSPRGKSLFLLCRCSVQELFYPSPVRSC